MYTRQSNNSSFFVPPLPRILSSHHQRRKKKKLALVSGLSLPTTLSTPRRGTVPPAPVAYPRTQQPFTKERGIGREVHRGDAQVLVRASEIRLTIAVRLLLPAIAKKAGENEKRASAPSAALSHSPRECSRRSFGTHRLSLKIKKRGACVLSRTLRVCVTSACVGGAERCAGACRRRARWRHPEASRMTQGGSSVATGACTTPPSYCGISLS